jgi:acyl carrier protein
VASAEDVRNVILAHFADSLAAEGIEASDVRDDFDLLSRGLIDSLGILEMISAIEAQLGIELDLEDLDPEQLTVIGPLCRFIEEKSRERSSGSIMAP